MNQKKKKKKPHKAIYGIEDVGLTGSGYVE